MKRTTENRIAGASLLLAGLVTTLPAWAATLGAPQPAAPIPERGSGTLAPLLMEREHGSATLMPLMLAETQAHEQAVDTQAKSPGGTVSKPMDDINFVKRATDSTRKEIKSAQDALPQLRNPELKRIAEMLVQDHSSAGEKLSTLAAAKGWPLPAPQPETAPPSGTSSGDFDARWTAEMIAGHERSVALYRAQAQGGEDADLRKFASDTLPTIESHLAQLKSANK